MQQIPTLGDRVRMTGIMPDDPCPLPIGTEGTVTGVQPSVNQIYVDWDPDPHAGRRSLILLCTDPFEILPPTCILTGGVDPDDCTTHNHEVV